MVAGGRAMRGVHSRTRVGMLARPWVREWLRSSVSCWGVRASEFGLKASGRTAQTAATQGREVRGEGGDGDETEVGAAAEELVGTARRQGVVELVALGEGVGEGRVLEVPHEGGGVEEVDGGYADGI